MPLGLFVRGRLVAPLDADAGPWLPLGADRLGRDGWARLIVGARRSLGVALVACAGALALGLAIGVVAGYAGGVVDAIAHAGRRAGPGAARPLRRAGGARRPAARRFRRRWCSR